MGPDERQRRTIQRLGVVPTGLSEYSTATLSDALQALGLQHRILSREIRPLLPFRKMAGTAVTLKLTATRQPSSYSAFMAKAFEAGTKVSAPILVIEQPPDVAGSTVLGSGGAQVMRDQFGYAGCVMEGAVRDSDDLRRMNFQVYGRPPHPEYISGLLRGVSMNEPVNVGGVTVTAGDIVVGDNDGVAVIPSDSVEQVLEAADAILRNERQILDEIAGGAPYIEVLRRRQPDAFHEE